MDLQLYRGFAKAHDSASLYPMIDKLARDYRLRAGGPVLRDRRFTAILAQSLTEIRSLPEATIDTIDGISRKFYELDEVFRNALERVYSLPDVSLSKLLHFVHPGSFWILDSQVKTLLTIWGYPNTFSGFGKLLKDLFRDPEFESLRSFLVEKDRELVGNHPMNSLPYPFLKLVDKLLWTK